MMKTFYPFALLAALTACQAHQQETVKSKLTTVATVPVATTAAKSLSAQRAA